MDCPARKTGLRSQMMTDGSLDQYSFDVRESESGNGNGNGSVSAMANETGFWCVNASSDQVVCPPD